MLIKKLNHYRKLSSIFVFLSLNSNSYALSQERNLDIYGGIGYTKLNDFSFQGTSNFFKKFSGGNLGVSALYTFDTNTYFKPVFGGGFSATDVCNDQNFQNNPDVKSVKKTFEYYSLIAQGGVKFYAAKSLMIYGLGNLGYAVNNEFNASYETSNQFILYANSLSQFRIKNHYFYGVNLMGAYNFIETFSLGGGLTYNRHSMNLEYIAGPETTNESGSFNEYSANIIVMWSL